MKKTELAIRVLIRHDIFSDNFYLRLGVDSSATEIEIRKAYRRLAAIYHPDTGVFLPIFFNMLAQAHTILIDKTTRDLYDQFGHLATSHRDALAEAAHLLPQLLFQAMRDNELSESVDYINELEKYVNKELNQIIEKKRRLNVRERKFRQLHRRLIRKDSGQNIFDSAFTSELKRITNERALLSKTEFLYKTMATILKDYAFDADIVEKNHAFGLWNLRYSTA